VLRASNFMKLYDTFSHKKKTLKPRSDNKIEIFVCGPTVYDYSHIGHARTYIVFDAFVKYLRHLGYSVRYIQNITDIDDKIITRAEKLRQTPSQLAQNFETEYYHDMEKLGIDSVDKYARATDYIPQIINQAQRLVQQGFAYEIKDDGIYFDISKLKDYGKLSGRTVEAAEDATSRIDHSINKKNKGDFALWKYSKEDGPNWDSPWDKGRPGWHIEDTAITESEFGPQYDIHGGARDLIFPHHEAEIAQMESVSKKTPLVNYWMHTGFLTISGQKMAKSLGNFITIHELLREHSKEAFRLFILSSHYRSPINYDEKAVKQADTNLERLEEFIRRLSFLQDPSEVRPMKQSQGLPPSLPAGRDSVRNEFFDHLNDDFNTPKALAVLFELVRDGNILLDNKKIDQSSARSILNFLACVNNIFGIIPIKKPAEIPGNILGLVDEREKARGSQNWKEADRLRAEIEILGYSIKDTDNGPEIKPA